MTTSTANNQKKYFDLHTQGIGYVNRIREIPGKQGSSFWVCDISALHGEENAIEYTNFDCRVSGTQATKIIIGLEEACQKERKILIGFKVGDLTPETFTYKSGKKQGTTGINLKARLLSISWAKVEGVTVYAAPKPDHQS